MPSSFYHFSPFRHHPGTAQLHFLSSERKKGTGATLIRKSGMRQPFHYPLPHIRPQYLALLPQRPYRKSPDGSRNDKGLRVMDGKFRKVPLGRRDNRALAVHHIAHLNASLPGESMLPFQGIPPGLQEFLLMQAGEFFAEPLLFFHNMRPADEIVPYPPGGAVPLNHLFPML